MSESEIKTFKINTDGFINVLTGMGTSLDKNSYAVVEWEKTDRQTAEAIYGSDDIASKIASVIPDDGTREGVEWIIPEGENPELIKYLDGEMDRLEIMQKIHWAWTLARVYGGSIIYLSVDDGREPEQPIDFNRIKQINSLVVFDRWQLDVNSSDLISDIRNPDFGYPVFYNFQTGSTAATDVPPMRIHHSRVLRFDGIKLPTRLYIKNSYWHDSIYGKLYRSIRNYSSGFDSIANLLTDFNQPVFKIEGLAEALALDNSDLVRRKIESVQLSRSVARAVILDKQDEFSNIGASVNGLSELVKLTVDRLVGGSGIPHTRLLGESPSGLGATGNSELTDYYDMIKAQQEIHVRKPLQYLIDLIGMQRKSVKFPEGLSFNFCSLYQQDEQEKIGNRKVQADIDAIYMDRGVYDPYTVSKARFGTGEYSFETSIDDIELPSIAQNFEMPEDQPEGTQNEISISQPNTSNIGEVSDVRKETLNGAQITSIVEVLQNVGQGLLPRQSAVELLISGFGLERQTAENIVGELGRSFKINVPENSSEKNQAPEQTNTDAVEDEVDTIPTKEMASNAERGLQLREQFSRGGTSVGVARATSLKNREKLSRDTIFRMKSYFARHSSYEKETDPPSAGYIAWLLWGGDEGKAWAERKVEEIERLEDGEA